MGWNDHVDFVEMHCLVCDEIDVWECWDDTAKARYGGTLGEKLGHDVTRSHRCPNCGSSRGVVYDEDSDDYWDALAEYEAEMTDEEAEAIEEREDPRGHYEK
jgi:hypothetical protein